VKVAGVLKGATVLQAEGVLVALVLEFRKEESGWCDWGNSSTTVG
jgi:hypothetical protein